MHWQRLGVAALAVPATFVMVAATTPSTTSSTTPSTTSATSSVTSTVVTDPICAFTTGCVSPSPGPTPNAGVLGAGTDPSTPATPNTGGGRPLDLLYALPIVGLGVVAVRWARRRS